MVWNVYYQDYLKIVRYVLCLLIWYYVKKIYGFDFFFVIFWDIEIFLFCGDDDDGEVDK